MFISNEKVIFKKFLTQNSYFFLLTSLSMTFIVWIIQAVNNLDIVAEDGHSFLIYFRYTLLTYPKIFGKLLPIMFFISMFYTLSKYENDNELKIFWINGINKIKFYNVIIKYTLGFFFIQIFITSFFGPHLQNKARNYIQNSTMDFFPSLIQEKKFIDTVERLTIFIESKNSQNEFTNIYLKDDTSEYPKIIIAKKGELLSIGDDMVMRLLDGKFININTSGSTTSFNFDKTDFNLSKFLTKTTTHKKLQEKKISTLLKCVNTIVIKKEVSYTKDLNCNKDSIKEILSEVYNRIFKPLYLFSLSSIVIFLLTSNWENKNFKTLKLFIFFIGIFTIIFSEISVNYSGKSNLILLLCTLLPLIIFSILYIIFYKKVSYKNTKI